MFDDCVINGDMAMEDVGFPGSLVGGGWKDKQMASLGAKVAYINDMLESYLEMKLIHA